MQTTTGKKVITRVLRFALCTVYGHILRVEVGSIVQYLLYKSMIVSSTVSSY